MPPRCVATLDIESTDTRAYGAFIAAVRDAVAVQEGDQVEAGRTGEALRPVRMFRLRGEHTENSTDSVFYVRITAGTTALIDFYVQDTTLYGWGFALPSTSADNDPQRFHLYHASNPPGGIRDLAREGYTLHDMGFSEAYGSNGVPHNRLGWENLRRTIDDLRRRPDSRDSRQQVMGYLVEMISEAVRFREMARILARMWGTTEEISDATRADLTYMVTSWQTASQLFHTYNVAPGTAATTRSDNPTTLTRTYPSLAVVAAVLTILQVRQGAGQGSSRPRDGAAQRVSGADASPRSSRLYPVLDAGGNDGDGMSARFFRPGTCVFVDLSSGSVSGNSVRTFAKAFPALKDTDFVTRIDAVMPVTGSTADLWLFSADQCAEYNTGTGYCTKQYIGTAWPGLAATEFARYIDAAVQDPLDPTRHVYFFRESEIISYDLNTGAINGPVSIAEKLPGLAGTDLVHGVSAAVRDTRSGHTGQLWLFRGDTYVHYNIDTHRIEGPTLIHQGWAGLQRKAFTDGVSAVLPCPIGHVGRSVWMFHDDLYLRFDIDANTVTVPATPVASKWPGLGTDGFDHVDAVIPRPKRDGEPHYAWFFHKDRYLRYDIDNSKVLYGARPIADGWKGLKGTGFEYGIDSALPDPGNSDAVWIFAGHQYVRYYLEEDKLVVKPTPIAETWKALRNTPFSQRIDAACLIPGTTDGDVWLFHGDAYVRYNPKADIITVPLTRIMKNWNLGFTDR